MNTPIPVSPAGPMARDVHTRGPLPAPGAPARLTSSRHLGRCAALTLAAVCLAGVSALAADAPTPSPTAQAPKTQVLFLGAEIAVQNQEGFLPVQGVTENTILAGAGQQRVKVKIQPDLPLQITEAIKVSETEVTVDTFVAEPAYTPAADPIRRMGDAAGLAASASLMQDFADASLRRAEGDAGYTGAMAANATGPEERAMWAAQANAAASRLGQAQNAQGAAGIQSGDVTQSTAGLSAMGRQEGQFDALRVSFSVSADEELKSPYYAVIAKVRDPGSKPGQFRKWVYVRALDRLTPGESRRVLVFQGGFPAGYTLEDCTVHLYDRGREFATNRSRRRVAVTAEEAHQFKVVSYVTANKGRTLPAALATERPPADVRAHFAGQTDARCYVRVAKSGKITAIYADPDGKRLIEDVPLATALHELYFYPALDKGKPVETITPLDLATLAAR